MNTKVKTYSVPFSQTITHYGYIDCTEEQAREIIKLKQFYINDIENFQEKNLHFYIEDLIQSSMNTAAYFEVGLSEKEFVNDLVSQL